MIALAACWMARDGRSQQSSQSPTADNEKPAPVLKNKAYDVVLPVTVRDKKGVLVTNLQKSDLSLTEEGRPQTIKSFTRESNEPLRIGLLVETNRAVGGAMEAERKAAEKFIDQMIPEQAAEGKGSDAKNEAFLIHFDRQVELLQDFTDSREKLHHELDDMGGSRQAQNDTQGPETTGEERGDRTHGARGGNQLYDAIFLASDEVMAAKNGRKAVIIFSDGVDRGSKDRLNEALDAAEKAHVEIYTVYFKGEQDRSDNIGYPGGGNRRGSGWPGGGGGYPGGGGGYPGGGRRGGDGGPSDTGVDGKKIMQQIAERTGGHAFDARKKDDLEPIYNLIAEEVRSQYVLTYAPDQPDNEGGFHKVSLKANKDEYLVSIPEGYFAPGGDNSR
jgi:VWFA-related protein